jgi:hypothetical protein
MLKSENSWNLVPLLASSTKGGWEGHAKSSEIRLGRGTNYLDTRSCIQNPPTSWLVYIRNTFSVRTSHGQPWIHLTHHVPDSEEATTFPHIIFFVLLRRTCIRMTFFLGIPKVESRNCPSWSCTGKHTCQKTTPKEREKKQQNTKKQTNRIIILLISFILSINKNKSWSALENISVCQQHAHTPKEREKTMTTTHTHTKRKREKTMTTTHTHTKRKRKDNDDDAHTHQKKEKKTMMTMTNCKSRQKKIHPHFLHSFH